MTLRVIPRLDIKGPNLVKGIHLEGLRVMGAPEQFARYYYDAGADELLYMDVVASLYQRNSLLDIVEKTSREVFIPLTVGGGIRTLDDIRAVLRAGADKVAINTAAIRRPDFIREAAAQFGSSTIIVSIETIQTSQGRYEAYTDNGRERTGVDAMEWASRAVELGAGELLVTSVDREGTGKGFDLSLTSRIAAAVPIPVIAAGGAGSMEHILEVCKSGQADAVCIASLVHYEAVTHPDMGADAANEGNTEFLRSRREFSKIQPARIADIKQFLQSHDIPCRPPADEPVHA